MRSNKEEALNSIKGDVADLNVNLASKLLSQQLDAEGQRHNWSIAILTN